MIIHKNCGRPVQLSSLGFFNLILTFSVTERGIKPGMGKLCTGENIKDGLNFVCNHCGGSNVEIATTCDFCNQAKPIESLFKLPDISGMWCEDCARENFANLFPRRMALVLNKISD